ncbi:MAG: endonuclease domain-containing protein [Chloroflexi bacterium]|nr:endonuclease domain-containing protein [Chloroflexota bacterium]
MTFRGDQLFVTLLERCRTMRREATDAETLLWRLLRDRQLASAKFRRQHQYGRYVLDFYCVEHHLAIEADGAQHFGEHGVKADAVRTAALATAGIRVLRFTNREILCETEEVVEAIWREIVTPSPQPSPRGRGSGSRQSWE